MRPGQRAMRTVVTLGLSAWMIGAAVAENTTLYVENNTQGYVTVNVDGVYGCNTSAGSTCSIPVTVGDHDLHARRSDTGETATCQASIGSSGWTWTPWPSNNC